MRAFWRSVWLVARFELADAGRSRRAATLLLLYLAAATLGCNAFINVMHRLEAQLADLLQVGSASSAGIVTDALWKSERFRHMMISLVGDRETAMGLLSTPPVSLVYGWLAFLYTPAFVLMFASTRISGDVETGAARFVLFRTSRLAWCLGKYAGQALMLVLALALSAAGAWAVAHVRLAGMDGPLVARTMLVLAAKAWLYSLAFLGMALGLSQLSRSPNACMALGFVIWMGLGMLTWIARRAAGGALEGLWDGLLLLTPQGHQLDLWHRDAAHLASAAAYLVTLGLAYLGIGHAFFARKNL